VYEILRARNAVFMMEQKIFYPDTDGADYNCVHLFEQDENGAVTAYLRAYDVSDNGALGIGRVLTTRRGRGDGRRLIEAIAAFAREKGRKKLTCDAQVRSKGFYLACGFTETSEEFIEAGFPHVKMEYIL
jgi:ElaA protein